MVARTRVRKGPQSSLKANVRQWQSAGKMNGTKLKLSHMTPKDHFDVALERADHLLRLYDLLHDTRARKVRADWASKFLAIMHWPKAEKIVRVDGKDRDSILILRDSLGIDRDRFTHEYLAELLRATVVAMISALDRYMHDIVIYHSWTLLNRADAKIPKELKRLQVPVLSARHAVDKIRNDANARPGVLVKEALREHLHREYTFQRPDDVQKAALMLGIEDFWGKTSVAMSGKPKKEDMIKMLRTIAQRRNQIVHEADIVRKAKVKTITMRDISAKDVASWTNWMRDFVGAIDTVVAGSI